MLVLLLGVLALALWSWASQVGYSEADAIEFVSRAQLLVSQGDLGEVPTLRPFAFSMLFVPLFHVAEWVDLEDLRWIFRGARVLQILFSLALVFVTARIGAQLAGRRAGLAAGFLLGTNPVFLHYAVVPVSGVAASLCVACGLRACLTANAARGGRTAGLWFGLGLLIAYQSLMLALVAGAALLVRHRWRGRSVWLGFAFGLLLAFPVGMTVDRAVYGRFGASLGPYVVVNLGYILVRFMVDIGLRGPGTRFYEWLNGLHGGAFDPSLTSQPVGEMQGRLWYFETLPMVLVWPVIAFGVLALWRLTWRVSRPASVVLTGLLLLLGASLALGWEPARLGVLVPATALLFVWASVLFRGGGRPWKVAFLLFVVVACLLIMSSKGNKLFRLWLPVLPAVLAVCAWGWEGLLGRSSLRRGAALLLLLSVLPFAWSVSGRHSFHRYGAYWKAIEFVNAETRAQARVDGARREVLACAYQWAIYMRPSPRLENVMFPFVLDTWDARSESEKALQISVLDRLDWLLVHEPVLTMHPELMREVNRRMEVRAAFFDPEQQGALRPVFVLGRRSGRGHTFFDVSEGGPFKSVFSIATEPTPVRFRGGSGDESAPQVTLLDVEYKTLPGDGFGWLTWHWRADSELERDYRVLGRMTGPAGVHVWHNPHHPGYGVLPTSSWKEGWFVRESYIVAPRVEARADFERVGIDPAPGEFEAEVWVSLNHQPDKRRTRARLEIFREGEDRPVRATLSGGALATDDGFLFSKDGMSRVAALRLALDPAETGP